MGELRRQLAYKTEWHGSTLVIADRFYPSSKTFSGCGVITDTLALSARVFACDACGISVDRDENAARNLAVYFRFYNRERLHQALGYQTPAAVYRAAA